MPIALKHKIASNLMASGVSAAFDLPETKAERLAFAFCDDCHVATILVDCIYHLEGSSCDTSEIPKDAITEPAGWDCFLNTASNMIQGGMRGARLWRCRSGFCYGIQAGSVSPANCY
jgi:hypothetical protein